MLYGDSGSLFSPSKEEPRRSSLPSADKDPYLCKDEPTHWCVLVRENGAMEVRPAGCPGEQAPSQPCQLAEHHFCPADLPAP